jgi:hypothetical protein
MASKPSTSAYDNKNDITYHCHCGLVGRVTVTSGKFLSTFLSISRDRGMTSHYHMQFIETGMPWFIGCLLDREY